jgi:hypothetical protein
MPPSWPWPTVARRSEAVAIDLADLDLVGGELRLRRGKGLERPVTQSSGLALVLVPIFQVAAIPSDERTQRSLDVSADQDRTTAAGNDGALQFRDRAEEATYGAVSDAAPFIG